MTDSLGYRTKFAVVAPSTHSSVEPQNSGTHPRGVTDHFSHIPDTKVTDDASFVVMPNIPYPLPKRLRSPNSGWKAGDRDQCGGFGRLPTEF